MLLDLPKHLAIEATGKTGRGRTGRETRLLVLTLLMLLALGLFFYMNILPSVKPLIKDLINAKR